MCSTFGLQIVFMLRPGVRECRVKIIFSEKNGGGALIATDMDIYIYIYNPRCMLTCSKLNIDALLLSCRFWILIGSHDFRTGNRITSGDSVIHGGSSSC